MLRRCTPSREQAPRCGHDHLGETAYQVRLSLVGTRLPLLLLATLVVAGFLTGESPEGPTASVRSVLENSVTIEMMDVARDGTMVAITTWPESFSYGAPRLAEGGCCSVSMRPRRRASHSHQTERPWR